MKNLVKFNVIFLGFFIIFPSKSIAADNILPLPKPIVDQETKTTIAKKKEIYPQKKPTIKKIKVTTEKIQEEITVIQETKEEVFIYPEKKPLIFKKKIDKAVSKSAILSRNDFKIAKATFNAIDKKKWKTAIKLSKKSKNKILFKLVHWLYLKESINAASFYDYLTFINNNPYYPRISRLRYLAEHKINLNTVSPSVITKWFGETGPLSAYGKIKLGEIYLKQGNTERGSQLIKEGWIKAKLSKPI